MFKAVTHHGVRVGLLAGFLLLRLRLLLLLMPSAAPGGFGRGLLARSGRAGYAPITGLRVLRGLAGQLGFLRMTTFLAAAHMFGVRSTLFRRMPTGRTFLRRCGKRRQPGAFLDVSLHLLDGGGYDTETGTTSETRVVMRADNMVKVGRIVLDGICAKWTARDACTMPILGFAGEVDRDLDKRASRMQLLQQTQSSNSPASENHEDILSWLYAGHEQ